MLSVCISVVLVVMFLIYDGRVAGSLVGLFAVLVVFCNALNNYFCSAWCLWVGMFSQLCTMLVGMFSQLCTMLSYI